MRAIVTGGSGYFGQVLLPVLVERGFECVSIDCRPAPFAVPGVELVEGDITEAGVLERGLASGRVDAVFHLAAQIDFAVDSQRSLYRNNVDATRAVAELARKNKIGTVVFISSNSTYLGTKATGAIADDDLPAPIDEYGRSKVESERILSSYGSDFVSVSFRSPNIMDAGRLGLLSIFFDFIREGRKVWLVGKGDVRHQFIYGQDLVEACLKALQYRKTAVFNIGSDEVPTIREMYQYVVDRAATGARVVSLPTGLVLPAMKLAYRLGLSPLGEYQFRALTTNFMFDAVRVRRELGWAPTLNNNQMLFKAYEYYVVNRGAIVANRELSANRGTTAKLGVLRLLKLLS